MSDTGSGERAAPEAAGRAQAGATARPATTRAAARDAVPGAGHAATHAATHDAPWTWHYVRHDALPPLAWGAILTHGSREVVVHVGRWVDARPHFFAEGAWAGDFETGDLAGAAVCMASGGQRDGATLRFSAPSHPFDRLQYAHMGHRLIVSNSLPFLLALCNERLEPRYAGYRADLLSYCEGLDRYARAIPTAGGTRIHVAYVATLRVDDALRVRREARPLPPCFDSYASYVAMLRDALRDLAANAAAPTRAHPFTPLGTISSGYDSPAVAVLGREIGCRDAVTFGRPRAIFGAESDSGSPIAGYLGLSVAEYDREEYRRLSGYPEAEFLASGTGAEELVFAPVAERLAARLFLTGYVGDTVWEKHSRAVGTSFRLAFPNGSSFTEFRLRVGFVHVPVPAIGYLHHPAVHAISNAPEMQPWSVGGDYDRPIPRRLAEEAGVPREIFGQVKKAIVTYIDNRRPVAEALTPASTADFRDFVTRAPAFGTPLGRVRFRLMRRLYALRLRAHWRLDARAARLGRPEPRLAPFWRRFTEDPGEGDLAFHWAVEKLVRRYAHALAAAAEQRVAIAVSAEREPDARARHRPDRKTTDAAAHADAPVPPSR